jgi:hypothetical protein
MIRALKKLASPILLFAIVVVGGYFLSGLIRGLAVDDYFLGCEKWTLGRGGPRYMPAWSFSVGFNSVILIAFIVIRYAERDLNALRVPCGIFALLSVLGLLALHFPSYRDYSVSAEHRLALIAEHPMDIILTWYVWTSHLAFALIGPRDD